MSFWPHINTHSRPLLLLALVLIPTAPYSCRHFADSLNALLLNRLLSIFVHRCADACRCASEELKLFECQMSVAM